MLLDVLTGGVRRLAALASAAAEFLFRAFPGPTVNGKTHVTPGTNGAAGSEAVRPAEDKPPSRTAVP